MIDLTEHFQKRYEAHFEKLYGIFMGKVDQNQNIKYIHNNKMT